MKTIVRNDSKISLYLFPADTPISVFDDRMEVGIPIFLVIADCDVSNATVFEAENAPEDWRGWKYIFDDGEWLPNPDFEAEPS